jgi:hypothetical protein
MVSVTIILFSFPLKRGFFFWIDIEPRNRIFRQKFIKKKKNVMHSSTKLILLIILNVILAHSDSSHISYRTLWFHLSLLLWFYQTWMARYV